VLGDYSERSGLTQCAMELYPALFFVKGKPLSKSSPLHSGNLACVKPLYLEKEHNENQFEVHRNQNSGLTPDASDLSRDTVDHVLILSA
jgi:hypothetical protein